MAIMGIWKHEGIKDDKKQSSPQTEYREQLWTICALKGAMWVISSWCEQIAHKNEWIAQKIRIFRVFLTVFPFLCPRVNHRSSGSSLLLLFTKEGPWALRSGCSRQESDGSDSLFSLGNHSFAHKNLANRSKNRWANSQPWVQYTIH